MITRSRRSPFLCRILPWCLAALAFSGCELEDECFDDEGNPIECPLDADAGQTPTPDAGGTPTPTPDSGTPPAPTPRSPRYLWIYDLESPLTGSHPGADIDAVILTLSDGTVVHATRVTDSDTDPSVTRNQASNTSQILGPPLRNDGTCNVNANPAHWYSLAGGGVVIEFGRDIPDGADLTVVECPGVADSYGVSLGFAPSISDRNADWRPLITDATGTFSIRVDYRDLGLR
jgi:hypothetical protein